MTTQHCSRRSFLAVGAAGVVSTFAGCATRPKHFALSEDIFPSYIDDKTGARVRNLTPGTSKDLNVYQTHAMWTRGMKCLVIMSDRSGAASAPHLLCMRTGEARPILEQNAAFSLAWDSSDFYFLEGRNLCHIDAIEAFEDRGKSTVLAELPVECSGSEGALSVGADPAVIYVGVVFEQENKRGILAYDRAKQSWSTLTKVDFTIGHVQANPLVPGQVSFCYETGGDSPQRMWFVDAKDGIARPLYKETYGEWVTHEVWWGPDKMLFTMWPYDEERTRKPHGVAVVDRDSGAVDILAQYPAWHAAGSRDRRWVMGDDFDRNIWLIDPARKERRLLTQGHLGKDCNTHPHASFTPDNSAILFGSSRSGNDDVALVELAPWDSLPTL